MGVKGAHPAVEAPRVAASGVAWGLAFGAWGQARGAWQGVTPKKEFYQVPAFLSRASRVLMAAGLAREGI